MRCAQALQAEEEKTSAKSRLMEKEEESRARDLQAAEEGGNPDILRFSMKFQPSLTEIRDIVTSFN